MRCAIAGAATDDGDDVEAHRVIGEVRVSGQEHCGGAHKLLLLSVIHRNCGRHESGRLAITYFDENEAVVMEHDEVDLTAAMMKVTGNQPQTLIRQQC